MANVLGFGAVGDGVADDTDALQHALNDGDGVLRLNKGTYHITKPLILDLKQRGFGAVRGEAGTSRIVMTGPGPALRVIGDHQGTASPASVQDHTWSQERFPTPVGVCLPLCRYRPWCQRVCGWRSLDSEPPKDGLRFEDSENVLLSGLTTQRFCAGTPERGAAVTFVRCQDCGISDCHILDPLHRGIELEDCIRCRVANNTIVDRRTQPTMRHAIRILGLSRHNLVTGNILRGATDKLLEAPEMPTEVRDNLLLG